MLHNKTLVILTMKNLKRRKARRVRIMTLQIQIKPRKINVKDHVKIRCTRSSQQTLYHFWSNS